MAATAFLAVRPPIGVHHYVVLNAVPGSVMDDAGRVGRIYSDGPRYMVVVIFNKGCKPRHGTLLDRIFTPSPSFAEIHNETVFYPLSLVHRLEPTDEGDEVTVNCCRSAMGNADEVFDEFMLVRGDGFGWDPDGVTRVIPMGKGVEQRYKVFQRADDVATVRIIK